MTFKTILIFGRLTGSAVAGLLASAFVMVSCSVFAMDENRSVSQAPSALSVINTATYEIAAQSLTQQFDRIVDETITLTQIPAPPFQEDKRAEHYVKMFKLAGFADVMRDAEGNVLALLKSGKGRGDVIVVSAHMDTVFPIETDVTVQREGYRLTGPGTGDDAWNMSVILAYARIMKSQQIQTDHDILFVGTVGEEGPGDLRGVRHLLTKGAYAGRIKSFFSFDGLDPEEIVNQAAGSFRYRSTFTGPGGHSYGAFGIVNPIAAAAKTVSNLYDISVPIDPKTTYAASLISGGVSINSIPNEAVLRVDLRSKSARELGKLDAAYKVAAEEAAAFENTARSTQVGAVSVSHELIGNRPAGETEASHPFAAGVRDIIAAHGYKPRFIPASTDANLPMSLGIPALTIGSGGFIFGEHSLDEYIIVEPAKTLPGLKAGYAAILFAAGLEPS